MRAVFLRAKLKSNRMKNLLSFNLIHYQYLRPTDLNVSPLSYKTSCADYNITLVVLVLSLAGFSCLALTVFRLYR